jgi:hypothetical protein
MSYQIADVLLKEKFIAVSKKTETKTVNPEITHIREKFSLAQITGNYEREPGSLFKFSIKNDSLQLVGWWNNEPLMLINTEGNTYKEANNPSRQFIFSELKNHFTQKLTVSGPSFKSTAKRKEKIDFSALNLADYIGDFYSEEIDATHLLFLEDGQLKVKIANNELLVLAPKNIDTFYSDGYFVHFMKTNGKVSGFNLKAGWVTNLKFKKK